MKSVVRRLLHGKPTEEAILLRDANQFPRFTPHRFTYRGMNIEVSDFLSVAWQIAEIFGEERLKFESKNSSPVILDCGANVGIAALYFSRLYPQAQLHCFEPENRVLNCLKNNLSSNQVTTAKVHEKAVWINNDGVNFGGEGADGGSVYHEKNSQKVPSVRLKDVLGGFERVDVLKMDIEGAEVEVLKDCGDSLKKIKYLYVEYHSFQNRPQQLNQLLGLLTELGFRYQLKTIGHIAHHPFLGLPADLEMDIQLDIHAINERI